MGRAAEHDQPDSQGRDVEVAMRIDWHSPESIAEWWSIWPERHGELIAWRAKVCPQFAAAIRAAGELIRARNPRA